MGGEWGGYLRTAASQRGRHPAAYDTVCTEKVRREVTPLARGFRVSAHADSATPTGNEPGTVQKQKLALPTREPGTVAVGWGWLWVVVAAEGRAAVVVLKRAGERSASEPVAPSHRFRPIVRTSVCPSHRPARSSCRPCHADDNMPIATCAALLLLLTLGLLIAAVPSPPPAPPSEGDECAGRADGSLASATDSCRRFSVCVGGRVAMRRLCAAGALFDGHACVTASSSVACREAMPPRGPCAGLPDAFYAAPDAHGPAACREYVYCAGGEEAARARCDESLAWNGTACAPPHEGGTCVPPRPWAACRALPPGLHPDRAAPARCATYFQCARGNRTLFHCPPGTLFDAQRRACVSSKQVASSCSATEGDEPCAGAADGYRSELGSGCRSYFYCAAGHKITYVCPAGHAFDGQACVSAVSVHCADTPSGDCAGRRDGYHPDAATRCRRYFFCLAGARVVALHCPAGRVFDGRRCIQGGRCATPPLLEMSAAPPRAEAQVMAAGDVIAAMGPPMPPADCNGRANGFYQDLAAHCRRYFFCIEGRKTSLVCPPEQVFDGQLCVDNRAYTCPTD